MSTRRSPILGTKLLSMVAPVLVMGLASTPAAALYIQTNLVSDLPGVAVYQDPNLVNPWGLARSPSGPYWVSDAGSGVATVYDGDGAALPLVVTVPPPGGGQPPAAPTGQVFNDTTGFEVSPGQRALFLFATEDGTISGWNPAASQTQALLRVDDSVSGADYKGLALGISSASPFLYAADFAGAGIRVFDSDFSPASLGGSFLDPNLPAGYAPFNVQNLGGSLFVTYALRDATSGEQVPGLGNGLIDVFDTSGNLVRRFASGGVLDAPWGLALAPANFGEFSNALLVGNFGDGRIHAFDPATGDLLGALEDAPGEAIEIEGLWALSFGGGAAANGSTNSLFFTAGIGGPDAIEDHGLFGKLTPVPECATGIETALGLGGLAVASRRRALAA